MLTLEPTQKHSEPQVKKTKTELHQKQKNQKEKNNQKK